MTRRPDRLLPVSKSILLLLFTVMPAAWGQEADWESSAQVASSAGDSEEFLADSLDDPQRWPTGFSYAQSSDLELGRDPAHALQIVGLRFADLQIPTGAQIDRAVIEFTADSDQSGPLSVTVGVQEDVETEPFRQDGDGEASFDLSDRRTTGVTQSWTPEEWTAGSSYTSPDISRVLQSIVGSEGWQAGGSIVLLLRPAGGDGLRSAFAYDSDAQLAPKLLVSFTGGTQTAANRDAVQGVVEQVEAEPAEPPVVQEPEQDERSAQPAAREEEAEAAEAAAEPEVPEVEVRPVDPDPILPPLEETAAASVWPGPDQADGQAVARPLEDAPAREAQAPEDAPAAMARPPEDAPVARGEPRRQRFPLVPNYPRGLEGSVLLSDYGGGVTVVTVFLENPDPRVTYSASLREGACGNAAPLVVDLQPIPGDRAFSTSLLSWGFDELLGSDLEVTVVRPTPDFVRVAACAPLPGR